MRSAIRRDNNFRRKSFFERNSLTNLLIYFNVAVFVIINLVIVFGMNLGGAEDPGIFKYIAINPQLFVSGYVWTVITSIFMHASFSHLLVNMISMFFMGNLVEKIIGRKRFLRLYFTAGIIAGLTFVGFAYIGLFIPEGEAFFGGIDAFAVGASGALFGLGGLLAVLIPRLRVLVFFVIPMPMWAAMIVLMFGLWILSAIGGWPIGNTAHFGGLIVGVIYGFYLRHKYARKVNMLNRMFT